MWDSFETVVGAVQSRVEEIVEEVKQDPSWTPGGGGGGSRPGRREYDPASAEGLFDGDDGMPPENNDDGDDGSIDIGTPGSWLKSASALINTPNVIAFSGGGADDDDADESNRGGSGGASRSRESAAMKRMIENLHKESEVQHSTIVSLKEEKTDLGQQLADCEAKFKKLKGQAKAKIKAAEDKAAKAASAAGSRDAGAAAADPPNEELQAKLDAADSERDRLGAMVKARDATVKELQDEISTLELTATKNATSSGAAQEQLTESVGKLNEMLAEKESFSSNLAELEEQLEAKSAAITARNAAVADVEQKLAQEQKNVAEALRMQVELEKECAILKGAAADATQGDAENRNAISEKLTEAQATIEKLTDALAASDKAAAAAAAAAAAQSESSAQGDGGTDSGAEQLEALELQVAAATADVRNISKERDAAVAEQDSLEAKVQELSKFLAEAAEAAAASEAKHLAERDAATAASATVAAEQVRLEEKVQELVATASKAQETVAVERSSAEEAAAIELENERAVSAQQQKELEVQVASLQVQLEKLSEGLSSTAESNNAELAEARAIAEEKTAECAAAQTLANQYSAEMSETVVREAGMQATIDELTAQSQSDAAKAAATVQDLRTKLEAAATAVKQSEKKMGTMTAERSRLVASVEKAGARRKEAIANITSEFEAQLKAKDDELQMCQEQIRDYEESLDNVEDQVDKERGDAETAKEALDEADAKVVAMESQVSKMETEKDAAVKQAEETAATLADTRTLLAESTVKRAQLEDTLAGVESQGKEALEKAVADVIRLTAEQEQNRKDIEMQASSAAVLQLALRTAEQQVARAEQQHLEMTNEIELLKLQREEASASLDLEQQASESKLQAAESEIEDLTQQLYEKSNRLAGVEAELESERLKAMHAAAEGMTEDNALVSAADAGDAEEKAAENERELTQARDQLTAALREAELTRQQLVAAVAETDAAKSKASQASAELATSTLAFEVSQREHISAASGDRQELVQKNAAREAALEKRISELQAEAAASAAQLALLGGKDNDSIAINIDAAGASAGESSAVPAARLVGGIVGELKSLKGPKGGAFEGVRNLAKVFMCYRLDSQMQLYLVAVHALLLYAMLRC